MKLTALGRLIVELTSRMLVNISSWLRPLSLLCWWQLNQVATAMAHGVFVEKYLTEYVHWIPKIGHAILKSLLTAYLRTPSSAA